MQTKCLSRLNIIKILSHKFWRLSEKTLVSIFNSLVRSVLDYSFFITPTLAESNLEILQRIQNKALRSILKPSWETTNEVVHIALNVAPLRDRFLELFERYINGCKVFESVNHTAA